MKSPIRFQAPHGGSVGTGYEATILADLKELCRLNGVTSPSAGAQMRLPGYFGHLTNDLVYARSSAA